MGLEEIIAEARQELETRSKVYEAAQVLGRETVRASKQATFRVHRRDLPGAEERLSEAEKALREIACKAEAEPELKHSSSFILACQEYAEAKLLLALIKGQGYQGPKEIGVQPLPYLLGLADLVGELRRAAVDSLRDGRLQEAEQRLTEMEEIYVELFTVENPLALSQGLRRKLDIARRLIEATRGEVALEVRRTGLEEAMNQLRAELSRLPEREKKTEPSP